MATNVSTDAGLYEYSQGLRKRYPISGFDWIRKFGICGRLCADSIASGARDRGAGDWWWRDSDARQQVSASGPACPYGFYCAFRRQSGERWRALAYLEYGSGDTSSCTDLQRCGWPGYEVCERLARYGDYAAGSHQRQESGYDQQLHESCP